MFDHDIYPARVRHKEAVLRSRRLSCGCRLADGADTYVRGYAGDEHLCAPPGPDPYPAPPARAGRSVPGTWEPRGGTGG